MAWSIYYETEEDPHIHIVPDFGPAHELDVFCWCHPDPDDQFPNILIHHVPQ